MGFGGDLLKEFLVGLSIAVDDAGLRKLDKVTKDSEKAAKTLDDQGKKLEHEERERLKRRTEHHERFGRMMVTQGVLIADAIEAAAKAVATATAGIADGLAKALHAADRTKSSVASLQALEFAFGKIGLASGTATGMVESFEQKLRNNPGLQSFAKSLGVTQRGAEGALQAIELLHKKYPKDSPNEHVGAIQAGMLGFDEATYDEVGRKLPQIKAYQEEQRRTAKLLGLDYKEAAEKSEAFMKSLASLSGFVTTAAQKLLSDFLPALTDIINEFLRWAHAHPEQIHEVMTKIGDAANTVGSVLKEFALHGNEHFKEWTKEGGIVDTFLKLVTAIERMIVAGDRLLRWLHELDRATDMSDGLNKIKRFLGLVEDTTAPQVQEGLNTISGIDRATDTGVGVPRDPSKKGYFGQLFSPDAGDTRSFRERLMPKGYGGKDAPGGGTDPNGGNYGGVDANVQGHKLRYPGASEVGKQRIASWLSFIQRPVAQGGMGGSASDAKAMVAMMQGESSVNLNPASVGAAGEIGTAQWHLERNAALKALAAKRSKPWQDMGVQQEHLRDETIYGNYRKVWNRIKAAGTEEEKLRIGIYDFESPKHKELAYQYRLVHLRRLQQAGVEAATKTAEPPKSEPIRVPGEGPPIVLKPESMGGPKGGVLPKLETEVIRPPGGGPPIIRAKPKDEGEVDWKNVKKWSDELNKWDLKGAADAMKRTPLGASSTENNNTTHNSLSQNNQTTIRVDGSHDPHAVAAAVAARQEGVHRMSLRNASTAMR